TNINRATQALLMQHPEWTDVRILPIGKKAVEFWRRRRYPLTEKTYAGLSVSLRYEDAREIARLIADAFLEERIDAAYVVVNEFRSILSQVVHVARLLPLAPEAAPAKTEKPAAAPPAEEAEARTEYIYEPDAKTILAWLLPRYLEFTVYRALAE